jgi:EAL domain-containing protein (putative c-di-GMP-specific phosphodiesterase class I)
VDNGELVVMYQPVFTLDEQIIGLEALVRWEHPTRGLLAPAEFIAAAEENGLIRPIGLFVLSEACRQLGEWQRRLQADLCMSVNLSGVQLSQPDFPELVGEILDREGLDHGSVCLEITESMLMVDAAIEGETLARLHELGVTLAADDFGTGYSSLLYLRRFPIDILKLDRRFVAGIDQNPTDRSIVGSMIDLAHSLELMAIAEGVETRAQLEALRSFGCDLAQGYLWSKPRRAEDLEELLAREGLPSSV